MEFYLSVGYNSLTFREFPAGGSAYCLLANHVLRKEAVNRFLSEEVGVVSLGSGRSLNYEVDEKKLKKLESLLHIDIRTKDIRAALGRYGNGEASLDETYDQYLPLLIARKLT